MSLENAASGYKWRRRCENWVVWEVVMSSQGKDRWYTFSDRDWALSFCRSKYYALSPFASWAGGRKIVIQALVQGKLFAEKWYMFSDYKQAPPSIAKGGRKGVLQALSFFSTVCMNLLRAIGFWGTWNPIFFAASNRRPWLELTRELWGKEGCLLHLKFEWNLGGVFFGCGLGRGGWLRGIE